MYHSRFKGSHYDAGYKWGSLLYKNNKHLKDNHYIEINDERISFVEDCINEYEKYYPEVLDEIRGIADGQKVSFKYLATFLLSMYCFEFNNKCTCFSFMNDNEMIFGRNSDFLVSLEKLYTNCLYKLDNCISFNANTTAFVQMEDGVNEYGLAIGLTFIYPKIRKPGLNAGMLVRYLLEKCHSTKEAISEIKRLPLASAQTITIADKNNDMVILECNPEKIIEIRSNKDGSFVATANNFNSLEMKSYRNPEIDDLFSDLRYKVAYDTLKDNQDKYGLALAKDLLSGKYGFMSQYDRSKGSDTVWSCIYDLKNKKIYRVEGNPSRKKYIEDNRLVFKY